MHPPPWRTLLFGFLVLGCSAQTTAGQDDAGNSRRRRLFVGQPFQMTANPSAHEFEHPSIPPQWMGRRTETNQLIGVPSLDDVGDWTYSPDTLLTVNFESQNPCRQQMTYWVELRFIMETAKDAMNGTKKWELAQQVMEHVPSARNASASIRVLRPEERRRTRWIEVIGDDGGASPDEELQQSELLVSWMAGCGDQLESAADQLDSVMDSADSLPDMHNLYITRGRTLSENQRFRVAAGDSFNALDFATTESGVVQLETSTAPTRSTTKRAVPEQQQQQHHTSPVVLPELQCTRGALCTQSLAETPLRNQLNSTAELRLEQDRTNCTWAAVSRSGTQVRVVPPREGHFVLQLVGIHNNGKEVRIPLSVRVRPSPPTTHLFVTELEMPFAKWQSAQPALLLSFVERLAGAVSGSADATTAASQLTVREVAANGSHTLITWSNNSIAHKECDVEAIYWLRGRQLLRHRNQLRADFVSAMRPPQFHVTKTSLELRGQCQTLAEKQKQASMASSSSPIAVDPTEHSLPAPTLADEPKREKAASWTNSWFPLVMLLLLLLLAALLLLVLCCVAIRRHRRQASRKRSHAQYISKGYPVVFPEEVATATGLGEAGAPLLVKEERAPLKVSQHENPLYRPPAHVVSTFNQTDGTTFTSVVATAQRQPPLYVPP